MGHAHGHSREAEARSHLLVFIGKIFEDTVARNGQKLKIIAKVSGLKYSRVVFFPKQKLKC